MTADVEDLGQYPHRTKVEALAGFGLCVEDIARVIDNEVDDVQTRYSRELAAGAIKANARVAESLYRKAIGEGRESVTAAIFWLKTRARWREVSVYEHIAEQRRIGLGDTPEVAYRSFEDAERFTAMIQQLAARTKQIG